MEAFRDLYLSTTFSIYFSISCLISCSVLFPCFKIPEGNPKNSGLTFPLRPKGLWEEARCVNVKAVVWQCRCCPVLTPQVQVYLPVSFVFHRPDGEATGAAPWTHWRFGRWMRPSQLRNHYFNSYIRWRAVKPDPWLFEFFFHPLPPIISKHKVLSQDSPAVMRETATKFRTAWTPMMKEADEIRTRQRWQGEKKKTKEMHKSVNLPLRAAAEVQISSLQSKRGGGGEDRRKRWGQELRG